MASFFDIVSPPTTGNPFLDGLIGPKVYKAGYTVTYALAGKPGSQGMYNDGGTLWAKDGARDAFRDAVSAWNAVSNLVIKPDPLLLRRGKQPVAFHDLGREDRLPRF